MIAERIVPTFAANSTFPPNAAIAAATFVGAPPGFFKKLFLLKRLAFIGADHIDQCFTNTKNFIHP